MRITRFLPALGLALLAGCVARSPQPAPEAAAHPDSACTVSIEKFKPPEREKTGLEKVLPEGALAGPAVELAGVRIVAVHEPAARAQTDYLTLDEAIAQSLCTVRETGTVTRDENGNERVTDGNVNQLLVSNTSGKPIFLMAGDLVLGGKQDRILASGLVVEPNTKDLPVNVFCVEHGRWTPHQGNADSEAGKFVNLQLAGQADIAVKRAAVGANDQSQVWQAVARNNAQLGVTASGGSFRATYDSEEVRKKLDELMAQAAPLRTASSVGYAVLADGEVAAMDLFDSTGLCAKLSEKLLRSYLVTALSGGYEPAREHPLLPRLRDKVTAKFDKVKLSEAVAALDKAWDAKLEFAGDFDPEINLTGTGQDMATVIDCLYVFFGAWANVKDENTIEIRSNRRMPPGSSIQLEDVQFATATNSLGTGNNAGFFFQDMPPGGGILLRQSIRGRFAHIFDNAVGNVAGVPAEEPPTYFGVPQSESENVPQTAGGGFRAAGGASVPGAAANKPIEYACKDAKRERTVHRGYMRR